MNPFDFELSNDSRSPLHRVAADPSGPRSCRAIVLLMVGLVEVAMAIHCGGGGGGETPAPRKAGTPPPIVAAVPAQARVTAGKTFPFVVKTSGQEAGAVRWEVVEPAGGTITPAGLYTAPATAGVYHVACVSTVDLKVKGTAEVTVIPMPMAHRLVVDQPRIVWGEVVKLTPEFSGGVGVLSPYLGCVESGQTYEARPSIPTTYRLVVKNELGDEAEATVEVAVALPPSASAIQASEVVQVGDQHVATFDRRAASIEWSIEGGTFLGSEDKPTQTVVSFKVTREGAFHLIAKVRGGVGRSLAAGALAATGEEVYNFHGWGQVPKELTPEVRVKPFLVASRDGWRAEVVKPLPGTEYAWTIEHGTLAASRGPSITFGSGHGPSLALTCTATQRSTGAMASTTVESVLLPSAIPPSVHMGQPVLAGYPYVAFVKGETHGHDFLWEMDPSEGSFEGGAAQAQGPVVTFTVAKPGPFSLRCASTNLAGDCSAKTRLGGTAAGGGTLAPPVIETPQDVYQETGAHRAKVQAPVTGLTYTWSIRGGSLVTDTGREVSFDAHKSDFIVLTCVGKDSVTGGNCQGEAKIILLKEPGHPGVAAPSRVEAGSSCVAGVLNGGRPGETYEWAIGNGKLLPPVPGSRGLVVHFEAGAPGDYKLKLTAINPAGRRSPESVFMGRVLAPFASPLAGGGGPSSSVTAPAAVPASTPATSPATAPATAPATTPVTAPATAPAATPATAPGMPPPTTPPPVSPTTPPTTPPPVPPTAPPPAPSLGPPPAPPLAPPMGGGGPGPLAAVAVPENFITSFTGPDGLTSEACPSGTAMLKWSMLKDPIVPSADDKNPKGRAIFLSRNLMIDRDDVDAVRLEEIEIGFDKEVRADQVDGIQRRELFTLKAKGDTPGPQDPMQVSLYVPGLSVLAGNPGMMRDAWRNGEVKDPLLFPGHAGNRAAYRQITGLAWVNNELFFAEGSDHTIRKLDAQGLVTDFMGFRGRKDEGNVYATPRLNNPGGLGVLGNDLIIADRGSHTVKAVALNGEKADLHLLAGTPCQPGNATGQHPSFQDLTALATHPGQQIIFLIDNKKVKMLKGGVVAALAPTFQELTDYNDHNTKIKTPAHWDPQGIAVDPAGGVVYVSSGNTILRLTPTKPNDLFDSEWVATRVAGQSMARSENGSFADAKFNKPLGLCLAGGILYVADSAGDVIRALDLNGGTVSTVAGGTKGWKDDAADPAFNLPGLVTLGNPASGATLFVSDQEQAALRRISLTEPDPAQKVLTLGLRQKDLAVLPASPDPFAMGKAVFKKPMGVGVDAKGQVFMADQGALCLFKIGPKGDAQVVLGRPNVAKRAHPLAPWSVKCPMNKDTDEAAFEDPTEVAYLNNGLWFVKERSAAEGKDCLYQIAERAAEGSVLEKDMGLGPIRNLRFALFPTDSATGRQPAILFSGIYSGAASPAVWAGTSGNQKFKECVVEGEAEALAVDRKHRVYVLTRFEGPEKGLMLTRYQQPAARAPHWEVTGSIHLFRDQDLDSANCGQPEIHHMAVDSKGNLHLADSANGIIWMVPEGMGHCLNLAGNYPELGHGEPGRNMTPDLQALSAFGGIAETAQDDLVFSSGAAVYQLTAPRSPAGPWTEPDRTPCPVFKLSPVSKAMSVAAAQACAKAAREAAARAKASAQKAEDRLAAAAGDPDAVANAQAAGAAAKAAVEAADRATAFADRAIAHKTTPAQAALAEKSAAEAAEAASAAAIKAAAALLPVDRDPMTDKNGESNIRKFGNDRLFKNLGFRVGSLPNGVMWKPFDSIGSSVGVKHFPAGSQVKPVMVTEVQPNSLAANAGLVVGAVIYRLNGAEVVGLTNFLNRYPSFDLKTGTGEDRVDLVLWDFANHHEARDPAGRVKTLVISKAPVGRAKGVIRDRFPI